SRTHYGTGYYIYHQFVDGIPTSRPIRSWTTNDVPDADVIKLIGQSGSDLLSSTAGKAAGLEEVKGNIAVTTNQEFTFCALGNGPTVLRSIEFTVPREQAL